MDLAAGGPPVIDIGSDLRLADPSAYPDWYGFEHPHPELATEATYGLPELHRAELESLVDAPLAIVGAPGCYPTAALLGLLPAVAEDLVEPAVTVVAVSRTSRAGRCARTSSATRNASSSA